MSTNCELSATATTGCGEWISIEAAKYWVKWGNDCNDGYTYTYEVSEDGSMGRVCFKGQYSRPPTMRLDI
jgi:hypothetical protein